MNKETKVNKIAQRAGNLYNMKYLIIILCLSSCTILKSNQNLVYESFKTIGKEGLKSVLKLDEVQLAKDSINAFGVYRNDYLVRKLGKGFTTALTAEGNINAKTKRFEISLVWCPAQDDTTKTFTFIQFNYKKKN